MQRIDDIQPHIAINAAVGRMPVRIVPGNLIGLESCRLRRESLLFTLADSSASEPPGPNLFSMEPLPDLFEASIAFGSFGILHKAVIAHHRQHIGPAESATAASGRSRTA